MDENGPARDAGELHVIIGAGAIGSGVARALAASDHRVRIITRSGSGPSGPSGSADRAAAPAELVAADASDAEAVARLTEGAAAIYNCANPPYHRWPALWPPIASSFTGDGARMAVVAGRDRRAWGRAWHAPSGPPRTQRDAIDDLARAAGRAPVPVRAVPAVMMRAAGLFSPLMRELAETRYQFAENFVTDSAAARQTFGLEPTPWGQGLAAVLRSYRWPGAEPTQNFQ